MKRKRKRRRGCVCGRESSVARDGGAYFFFKKISRHTEKTAGYLKRGGLEIFSHTH